MHDILIALVFVSMVTAPALVSMLPGKSDQEESGAQPENSKLTSGSR